MLKLNTNYTRKEINKMFRGGLRDYLPTYKGKVTSICVKKDMNPDAPNVILVGEKEDIRKRGEMLCKQKKDALPVFIQLNKNIPEWTYVGHYRVNSWAISSKIINKHKKRAGRSITKVIFLRRSMDSTDIDSSDIDQKLKSKLKTKGKGGGFGDVEKNREIEKAAISFVTKLYEKRGWSVESVENEKRGFDLLCTKNGLDENVEVKGVEGTKYSFPITAGEVRQARENPVYVIYIVTSALSKHHKSKWFKGKEFIKEFKIEPVQYRATLITRNKLSKITADKLKALPKRLIKSLRPK
ncbi:DUF3883 domain-containing protein [Desulfobacterota bacterium AH_259_B03_O07]|nr:DUF3883 domain-containing protein [Desulfobacterota bacterium AH_259_B03_O07]